LCLGGCRSVDGLVVIHGNFDAQSVGGFFHGSLHHDVEHGIPLGKIPHPGKISTGARELPERLRIRASPHPVEVSMTIRLSVATISVILALASGLTFGFTEAGQPGRAAQAAAEPQQPTMQEMMKMHEQMMAEMKAGEAKLDALVKEMNAAAGDAKVTALAAVVNELVRQHKVMHGRMGQMHQHMMGGRGMMMGR
jgi:hypothetical protein